MHPSGAGGADIKIVVMRAEGCAEIPTAWKLARYDGVKSPSWPNDEALDRKFRAVATWIYSQTQKAVDRSTSDRGTIGVGILTYLMEMNCSHRPGVHARVALQEQGCPARGHDSGTSGCRGARDFGEGGSEKAVRNLTGKSEKTPNLAVVV